MLKTLMDCTSSFGDTHCFEVHLKEIDNTHEKHNAIDIDQDM